MRITLVISSLGSGGAQRVLSLLANYWDKFGYIVTIVTLDDGKRVFFPLNDGILVKSANVNYESKNIFLAVYNNFGRILKLRKVLLDTKPDIIISFLVGVNVLVILATLLSKVKVIISERNHPQLCNERRMIWMFLRRILYPFASQLVVQTNEILGLLGTYNKNIKVIPNPVPQISAKTLLKKSDLDLPKGKKIISVGRLVKQKGFDLLLIVFSRLVVDHPGWSLIILGEGEQKQKLEKLCHNLDITKNVYFLGLTSKVFSVYRECDIFVLASRFEGFPNVLLEAMSCGLPVVSFACPFGPKEIIQDGLNGFLVENGDLNQMEKKISSIIEDDELRQRFAQNALEVKKKYSIEKVMADWNVILENYQK